ncbi:MAG: DUF4124 domain-containing protein [Pseudomonadales bacterium]|nr:DUF4124 domain-containing protein [Pseudomonadales bacterium]
MKNMVLVVLLSLPIVYWLMQPSKTIVTNQPALGKQVQVYRWQDADGVTHFSSEPHAGAHKVNVDSRHIPNLDSVYGPEAPSPSSPIAVAESVSSMGGAFTQYVHHLQSDEDKAKAAAVTAGQIPDAQKAALDGN